MSDQENLKASEGPLESASESWAYPDGFDTALRELYERSFEECNIPPETQLEVLEAFQNSGADAANLCYLDYGPSVHTAEVWAAGRLDLTAESLALSDNWKAHFPSPVIEHIETRLELLANVSDQQTMPHLGSVAPGSTDFRVENDGYTVRTIGNRAYLIFEPIPWTAGLLLVGDTFQETCENIIGREETLRRIPFFKYNIGAQHHHLFCESCQSNAPTGFALCEAIAVDQFHRMQRFLANLAQCLDLSETKTEKLRAALDNADRCGLSFTCRAYHSGATHSEPASASMMNAALWRAFLLANYLPYVADMSVYCPKPGTWSQPVNPWTTLRSGDGYPGAVRFVQSLTKEHFETAVIAYEIFAAMPDSPDDFAFRALSKPSALGPLLIPSNEDLQRIPGFLDVRENARTEDWCTFLSNTIADEIPWWSFDATATVMKLAAKAAKLAMVECGLNLVDSSMGERLEAIENQTHAIYGAQLPMLELQVDTKQAVDHVASQQKEQSDILQQIRNQLNRPTKRHAEVSLRKILGSTVFWALTDEAQTAALEGELRSLQGDYADASVIPFQFAKAFECQLRSIMEPFLRSRPFQTDYKYLLTHVDNMLVQSQADFLTFLRENGFDYRLLKQKVEKLIEIRNLAAHQAVISEQRALDLRRDWLGVGRSNDSIFAALIPKSAAGILKNEPRAGTS